MNANVLPQLARQLGRPRLSKAKGPDVVCALAEQTAGAGWHDACGDIQCFETNEGSDSVLVAAVVDCLCGYAVGYGAVSGIPVWLDGARRAE